MARIQIYSDGIYATLRADPALAALLGPATAAAPRILRGYPQLQHLLARYEPQSSDAWLVFEEPQPYPTAQTAQFESAWDVLEVSFTVYATEFATADAVIDVLDSHWHWHVDQQQALQYGDRILLQSRRYRQQDGYAEALKLPQRAAFYRMSFVKETLDG